MRINDLVALGSLRVSRACATHLQTSGIGLERTHIRTTIVPNALLYFPPPWFRSILLIRRRSFPITPLLSHHHLYGANDYEQERSTITELVTFVIIWFMVAYNIVTRIQNSTTISRPPSTLNDTKNRTLVTVDASEQPKILQLRSRLGALMGAI
jgi:hypothetical protein